MKKALCLAFASFFITSMPAAAQTFNKLPQPKGQDLVVVADVSNAPSNVPNSAAAAVQGINTSNVNNGVNGPNGVYGFGSIGVGGAGWMFGGVFRSDYWTGVSARGKSFGAISDAADAYSTGVFGRSIGDHGNGAVFSGYNGIIGIATSESGYAGQFSGAVTMSARLEVSGPISSPTIDELTQQINALVSRIAALEAR